MPWFSNSSFAWQPFRFLKDAVFPNQPRLEMGAKLSEEREQRLEQLRVERLKLEELKEQLQGQRKALMAGVQKNNNLFTSLRSLYPSRVLVFFLRLVVGCWVGWEEMNSRWKWKWDRFGVRGRCLKMGLWWFFLNMEGCHDPCNYKLTIVD